MRCYHCGRECPDSQIRRVDWRTASVAGTGLEYRDGVHQNFSSWTVYSKQDVCLDCIRERKEFNRIITIVVVALGGLFAIGCIVALIMVMR